MVGRFIKQSDIIDDWFKTRYINLGTSREVGDIGKGGFVKWLRYIRILWQTLYASLIFRPNITYLTLTAGGIGFYKDAAVALLAKLFGKQVVYHFHNKGVSSRQAKAFDNWLYKKVFNNAEVILLSPHLYYDIKKYVPEDRVHCCPNGIPDMGCQTADDGWGRPDGKNELEAESSGMKENSDECVNILFLSNLIKSKGVYVLLEACKQLKERSLPFHCTFVGGEGDMTAKDYEKKVKEWSLGNFVHYAGKKYGKKKEQVFAASDIFVHPSLNDCFPLVLLEAMQCSLPLVSTQEGGIPEMIEDGENGFLVPRENAEALADKLELLINNKKLRKKMGERGRKRYEKKYTVQAFEERLANILERIR